MLMTVVLEGWPKSLDEVSAEVKPYFQFREIPAQDGLLFKGERLTVPSNLRKEMIEMVLSSCNYRPSSVYFICMSAFWFALPVT